jgi:class 3 adenylate cyclase/tetratricopeptide (TPR) repeat protein
MVRYWDRDAPGELHQTIQGSMVLVDISGFTAMSERLAKNGRVGAEELTAVIGNTFSELLSAAYSYGASLLKFGGDALLLLFTKEEHERRACAAARAMRQTLAEVGVCYTSAGKVTLRMSVGVHSGEFDFFLVGGSHRELIVAGRGATRTVEMESAAGAGRILLSPETASAIPRMNRGKAHGPGILLKGEVDAERSEAGPSASVSEELNQFVPVSLCQLLLGGQVEPEHRPATVAFINFKQLDTLIDADGADAVARRLDELVRAVQEAVDQREVTFLATDIAADGGKIILTAGVPSATGHDEERMLLALRQVMSAGPPLSISVGVSWGPVFAGEVGTPYRRTYTVMGDTVNLAARLMARAPAGEIYATAEVLDGSRTTFEMTPIEPFQVKGKKQPVEAVSVMEPKGTKSGLHGLPLIGRDDELGRLGTAWEEAGQGKGHVVELSAEAGMGKSRLLEEFLGGDGGPETVIRAECRLYQAATPYFPFRALLREAWGFEDLEGEALAKALIEMVDEAAPEQAPWVSLIGMVAGIDLPASVEAAQLEDQFRPARTMAAVDALLEATIVDPTVLVIEDSHWMDEPSRELVAGLLVGLDRHPWLIVLTRRPGGDGFVPPEMPAVSRIELEPLGIEQAKQLIFRATEEAPLPPQQVERLARQAEGRPLFLIELLQTLRRTGSLEEIPQSVEAMIAARIDTLPLADRNVLRRLAVLGAGFRIEHMSAVIGEESTDTQWQTRHVRRLHEFISMDDSGWVQFHHSLIRDVAYAGLPYRIREELHARVGDAIFAECRGHPEEFAELLSLHYFHAKRWSRTWRFSRMAGDRAREIYANHEAAGFYERALQSSTRLDWVDRSDRVGVLIDLAKVLYEAGSYEQAVTSLREAMRLVPDDPVARADLRLELARCYQRIGALSRALRESALGLKLVDRSDLPDARRAKARLRAVRAGIFADQFRPRTALRVGLLAVEEAEASGELDALARAYTKIDEAYQILGLRDQAVHEEKALEIYEELGDLSGITLLAINLGVQAYSDGRWDDAISMYSKAQDVSRRSGDISAEGAAAANLGEVLISRGQLDEAETVLHEARQVLRGQKVIGFALFAEAQLGRLMLERGEFDAGVNALEQVIEEANRIGQPFFAVDASVHLADACTRSGEPLRALEVIEAAKVVAGEDAALFEVPLERLRAGALIAMGRPEEALGIVEHALASAREQRLVYEEALLLLVKAQVVADRDDALREANRLLDDLGASAR